MADVTVTPANVKKLSGTSQTNIAGVAITAGQTLYIDTSQLAQLADGDLSAVTALTVGMALCNAAANQPVTWAGAGCVVTVGGTVAAGVPYIQSANAGGFTADAPATGVRTLVVGIGNNATDVTLLFVTSSNQAVHA
jgi:hypothetical protein